MQVGSFHSRQISVQALGNEFSQCAACAARQINTTSPGWWARHRKSINHHVGAQTVSSFNSSNCLGLNWVARVHALYECSRGERSRHTHGPWYCTGKSVLSVMEADLVKEIPCYSCSRFNRPFPVGYGPKLLFAFWHMASRSTYNVWSGWSESSSDITPTDGPDGGSFWEGPPGVSVFPEVVSAPNYPVRIQQKINSN